MPIRVKAQIAAIGVDRGGTWTRAAAFDSRMRRVKTVRFRTAPLRTLPEELKRKISGWPQGHSIPLVIATRGALSRKWKKPFLLKALKGKLNLIDVISDAEAAHFAAFKGKPGILLISGTGAVAFSGKPGSFKMHGGRNPPSGDPGSGRWLGRRYLDLLGRLGEADAMGHGRSAAYAGTLLARAERGHKTCATIAAAAQHELAALLAAAAGEGKSVVKAALAGGLMGSVYFRTGFIRTARRALPGRRLVFVELLMTAEEAAARIALLRRKK